MYSPFSVIENFFRCVLPTNTQNPTQSKNGLSSLKACCLDNTPNSPHVRSDTLHETGKENFHFHIKDVVS